MPGPTTLLVSAASLRTGDNWPSTPLGNIIFIIPAHLLHIASTGTLFAGKWFFSLFITGQRPKCWQHLQEDEGSEDIEGRHDDEDEATEEVSWRRIRQIKARRP